MIRKQRAREKQKEEKLKDQWSQVFQVALHSLDLLLPTRLIGRLLSFQLNSLIFQRPWLVPSDTTLD